MRPQRQAAWLANLCAKPERCDPQSTPALGRRWQTAILVTGLALAIASGIVAYRIGGPYGEGLQEDRRVRRVVNEETRATEMLSYDIDGDLRFDTWSYMDGERAIRTEYDVDGDGRVDTWEYYRADGTTARLDADTDGNGRSDWRILFDGTGTMTSNARVKETRDLQHDPEKTP